MRVGISTSVIQRGKTGIAKYLFGLLKGLLAQAPGATFTLFVLAEDRGLFADFKERARIVSVPEACRSPVKDILWHQFRLPGLARQLALDVLHIPSYRRLLWRSPCPRVATIHDLAPFRVRAKYDPARMLYGKFVARILASRQEKIIAVSHNTARDIAAFFEVPPARVAVVPNGIDHERFYPVDNAPSVAALRERFGLERPFFLYVARLEHPGKNHVGLIAAFEKFKQATGSPWLLVFGGGDWHGSGAIHEAIRRSPFSRDIRCLGFVADSDIANLYRAAGVFVYPSLYEGFGMPPVEAMACGCPVIASACGALGEVVGDAARIVDPANAGSIAAQLSVLAADAAARDSLRAAGLKRAAMFHWSRTAAATLDIYRSACNRTLSIRAPAQAIP